MSLKGKTKGDSLEDAVETIESILFSREPSLKEAKISIERNKILTLKGAKNEIDLLVTIELAKGYTCQYLFECKNWNKKVGKNEIAVFADKIDAIKIAKGFFIAKTFTKDAIKRAEYDKIELIKVDDSFQVINIPVHIISPNYLECETIVIFGKRSEDVKPNNIAISMDDIFHVKGQPITLRSIVDELGIVMVNDLYKTEPNVMFTENTIERTRVFPFLPSEEFLFKNKTVSEISLRLKLEMQLVRPVIVSKYNIENRGRHYTVEFQDSLNNLLWSTAITNFDDGHNYVSEFTVQSGS